MEAKTELQTFLEQGKQALAQGRARDAAIAYAHGAQLEPNNPEVHLGLAEANLGLGNYKVVQMACQRVQELEPQGGLNASIAQALLDLLDRRYERALQSVDKALDQDPSIGYIHALRAQLLRILGQDYDANLARARATRLSYGGRYENAFPPIEPVQKPGYQAQTSPYVEGANNGSGATHTTPERESVPTWSNNTRSPLQRQMIRTRFTLSQYPSLITNILIVINLVIYLIGQLNQETIYGYGAQVNELVLQGEYWRLFTAMFLHADFLHIALNMLSLFFIGRAVEIFYGKWRYLVIYLLSGIAGGLFFLFLSPGGIAVGASGAIFGVFGALGVFYLVNRRALGVYGSGAIGNWLFWLVLNIAIGFSPGTNIAVWAHVGGLFAGMIISFILIPRSRRGRMMY